MAWTYIAEVSNALSATPSPMTVTIPGSAQEGDLMIGVIARRDNSNTPFNTPSGWVAIDESYIIAVI